ncbi:uncharacterized protein TNCV_1973821 [Trichonephila clavipes]|nr:uncharacterized protein TNCV_1973821 [Trichonephila clavipes]
MRQFIPTKEESRRGARVHSDKARETRTTGSKGHSVAEGRPDRSGKTTVRPCPYYLRSRFKEPEGIPEEQRNTGIDSLTQNSLSMETLDGDPAEVSPAGDLVCKNIEVIEDKKHYNTQQTNKKGHIKGRSSLGRAEDWYQIFGSTLEQNTATDIAQLKMALSKTFPDIRNKKDLEIRFYSSQQRRDLLCCDQGPTYFIYDLLKLHKQLGLGMSKEALVDHIFVRLEPQVQDYVEVQNPQNKVQLLDVLSTFEEKCSCKAMRGSRNSDNVERRGWNECRIVGEIEGIRKFCVDRVMAEMIIGVIMRMVVKDISG